MCDFMLYGLHRIYNFMNFLNLFSILQAAKVWKFPYFLFFLNPSLSKLLKFSIQFCPFYSGQGFQVVVDCMTDNALNEKFALHNITSVSERVHPIWMMQNVSQLPPLHLYNSSLLLELYTCKGSSVQCCRRSLARHQPIVHGEAGVHFHVEGIRHEEHVVGACVFPCKIILNIPYSFTNSTSITQSSGGTHWSLEI